MAPPSANASDATEHTEEARLSELLNQEAGLTSEIELKVIRAELIEYSGTSALGKEWHSQKMQVILQSKLPGEYCLGVAKLHRGDKAELKRIQDRFKKDTTWKFKAIKLVNERSAYIHTSVQITIDLRKSTAHAMLQSTSFPEAPEPKCSIAQILQLKQMQWFDVMAIPAKILDERTPGSGMRIIDVRLVDGSLQEGSNATEHEYASLPLTLFLANEEELLSFKKHVGHTPILFMVLAGSRTDGKVQVTTLKKHTWWRPGAGAKYEKMASQAKDICGDQATHTDIASLKEFVPQEAADYTQCPATLTVCRFMDQTWMSQLDLVGDATEHLYQLNHVYVVPPSKTDTITTRDDRLFSQLECWDHSKKIVLAFRSQAMLELAGLGPDESNEYKERIARDELRHPILSSLRVRVYKRKSADDNAASQKYSQEFSQVDTSQQGNPLALVVVEATPCMDLDIPDDSVDAIIGTLAGRPRNSDALAVVPLDNIKPSPFYNMVANDEPADKALALLRFTQRSNGKQLTHGFRIVADRVQDATATEHGAHAEQYSTVCLCSVEKVGDFTGGANKVYMAVISKVVEPTKPQQHAADLYVEAMEVVDAANIATTTQMMRQLQKVGSMHIGDATTSDATAWKQRKCRRLSRYPTQCNHEPTTHDR